MINGIRTGAGLWSGAPVKSEKTMTKSLRQNVELVSDPHNLDSSVEEVFSMMLGVTCQKITETQIPLGGAGLKGDGVDSDTETITAVVGFGGLLSGACVFRSGGRAALAIATKLVGIDFTEIDDTVKDAIGEICNMLAGTWKGKVPELASNCGLSIPAVITGSDYRIHVQAPEFKLHHTYFFEGVSFAVTIICDGLQ